MKSGNVGGRLKGSWIKWNIKNDTSLFLNRKCEVVVWWFDKQKMGKNVQNAFTKNIKIIGNKNESYSKFQTFNSDWEKRKFLEGSFVIDRNFGTQALIL